MYAAKDPSLLLQFSSLKRRGMLVHLVKSWLGTFQGPRAQGKIVMYPCIKADTMVDSDTAQPRDK